MYKQTIQNHLDILGLSDFDTRHVEAWMRLEHSTLDGLHHKQFNDEVLIAAECINQSTYEDSENLAQSFNL